MRPLWNSIERIQKKISSFIWSPVFCVASALCRKCKAPIAFGENVRHLPSHPCPSLLHCQWRSSVSQFCTLLQCEPLTHSLCSYDTGAILTGRRGPIWPVPAPAASSHSWCVTSQSALFHQPLIPPALPSLSRREPQLRVELHIHDQHSPAQHSTVQHSTT